MNKNKFSARQCALIFGLTFFVVGLICFSVSQAATAPTIILLSSRSLVYANDVFLMNVELSTGSESINVADVNVQFDPEKIRIEGVSTGDSVFTLWTRTPVFSNAAGRILATGGVPSGFKGRGNIMTVIVRALTVGDARVSLNSDSSLYRNDGRGTRLAVSSTSTRVGIASAPKNSVVKDDWSMALSLDTKPPENLELVVTKNPDLFNNRYFAAFSAYDDGVGVYTYEVGEGDDSFVVTESPYVLQHQWLGKEIRLRVTDRAGNVAVKTLYAPARVGVRIAWAAVGIALLLVIFFSIKHFYSIWRRR